MKKNEGSKKDSRLEKVVVFLLVVLISLLSFSVGVISGKGLSDKEYALKAIDQKHSHALNEDGADDSESELSESEIQQLANAAIQAAEKNGDVATDGDDHEAAEIAALEKKAASNSHAADSHAATNGHGNAAATAKTTILEETKKSATTTAATNAHSSTTAAAAHDEDRFPTSVKKGAAEAEFTVQVAAYPNPKDAETLAATLIKKGHPAFPIKVMSNGAEWHKVNIGSFKTRKEAMDYQAELKKQGIVKEAFIQKITK